MNRAEHVQDPAEENRTLCGLVISDPASVTDIRNGISRCRECTRQADLWWSGEEATWD